MADVQHQTEEKDAMARIRKLLRLDETTLRLGGVGGGRPMKCSRLRNQVFEKNLVSWVMS